MRPISARVHGGATPVPRSTLYSNLILSRTITFHSFHSLLAMEGLLFHSPCEKSRMEMEFSEQYNTDSGTFEVKRIVRDENSGQVTALEPWVSIRPSKVKGAGDGVFADRAFPADFVLGYYVGAVEYEEVADGAYLMTLDHGMVVNGSKGGNWTRKINDGGLTANPRWRKSRMNVFFYDDLELVTNRAIRKGEELFVEYGDEYWASSSEGSSEGQPEQ